MGGHYPRHPPTLQGGYAGNLNTDLRECRNIQRIIDVKPEVVSHNLETVKRLTRECAYSKYERSLQVLLILKEGGIERTKSALCWAGGNEEELLRLWMIYVRLKLIYLPWPVLQPTRKHLAVAKYVTPEDFARYKQ